MPGSMPFRIDAEGKSVLSKEWADPIDALYSTILERAEQQVVGVAEEVVATESTEETMAEETIIKPVFEAEALDYIAQIAQIINRHTENQAAQATEDAAQ
jgi:hypothetical protein